MAGLLGVLALTAGCAHHPPRTHAPLRETCDRLPGVSAAQWQADVPRTGRFDDAGEFFRQRDPAVAPPEGWRLSTPLNEFLTLELYSRARKDPREMVRVVDDPSQPGNRVWRLAAPEHTDGILLRTTRPLGSDYRVCARVGHIAFGSGHDRNGYDGDERAAPWIDGPAVDENGCYFGAIYRSVPIPQNNAAAHDERLVFIDSDNNTEGWTKVWDPMTASFLADGRHPVVMGAVPAVGAERGGDGRPFRAFAAGQWHPPGRVVAADAYEDRQWYVACIERRDGQMRLSIAGRFRFGGPRTYEGTIALEELADPQTPHYWLLGDPHTNYYEGSVLVDEITLTR
jgi:hypothetical protein